MVEPVPVTPTLSLIPAPNNGRFPYAHALLVRDGGITALVDTGCGHETLRALLDTQPVDLVINTHSHVDHISGNSLLAGRPIWLPAGIGFETAGSTEKLAARFVEGADLQALYRRNVAAMGYRDTPPTDAYPPDHVFELGGTRLHAIPAPGHLLDHVCLWEPESGTLLATDIDFTGFGPWYGNPESDIETFIRSIERVWALRPRVVISSHKGVFREGLDAHFQAYLDHFERRESRLLEMIAEPRTLDWLSVQGMIYRRFPRDPALLQYFEGVMIEKHLRLLAAQDRAREVAPGCWQRV